MFTIRYYSKIARVLLYIYARRRLVFLLVTNVFRLSIYTYSSNLSRVEDFHRIYYKIYKLNRIYAKKNRYYSSSY